LVAITNLLAGVFTAVISPGIGFSSAARVLELSNCLPEFSSVASEL
jgi:hypothetical protein